MSYHNTYSSDYHTSAYLVYLEGAPALSDSDILTPLPTSIPGLDTAEYGGMYEAEVALGGGTKGSVVSGLGGGGGMTGGGKYGGGF